MGQGHLGSAYGIRTRGLRLERAASWAARRMRLEGTSGNVRGEYFTMPPGDTSIPPRGALYAILDTYLFDTMHDVPRHGGH